MRLTRLALSILVAATVVGGCAALTDRRADAREEAAELAYPPTGQMIDVGGVTIHAHVQGTGPDLVLIHGASGNTRDFTYALVDQLAKRYRVIAFDRPGMGWSDPLPDGDISPTGQAQILAAAADTLGVRDPIVLGHSYGGAVAMAWGLLHPDDTGALVIVSGATMPWPGGLGGWYAIAASRIGAATVIPAVTAFASTARTAAVVDTIFAPDLVPPGYADYVGIGLTLRRDALRVNARQVGGLKPYLAQMLPRYGSLTLPVELIHGMADTTVPPRIHAIPLAGLLPNAHLDLIEGAAHMPHHSHADRVIAAIDRANARR